MPDKFKIVESEKLKTGGMIHYSSPAFGPEGLMAVGSNDKQIHFYKYNPQTHKIEFLAKRKLGGWVSSSPVFGPNGLIAVGSNDHHIYFFKHNPQTDKIQFLEKHKTESGVSSSPAFGSDGTVIVGSEDSNLYIYQIVRDDSKTSKKSRGGTP